MPLTVYVFGPHQGLARSPCSQGCLGPQHSDFAFPALAPRLCLLSISPSCLTDQKNLPWGYNDPLLCLVFQGEAYKGNFSIAAPELVYRLNMLHHVA